MLSALGGLLAYLYGKRVDRERGAEAAYSGVLLPSKKLLLSGLKQVWPDLEIGDSGAILRRSQASQDLLKIGELSALTISTKGGRVSVSTKILDHAGRVVAELVNNEWMVNPHNSFDRDYSADALEVKDSAGDVVLQIRILPDRVRLQAKFYGRNGASLGIGKICDASGQWGGGVEWRPPGEPLSFVIAPLFRYPSRRHLGELVE